MFDEMEGVTARDVLEALAFGVLLYLCFLFGLA